MSKLDDIRKKIDVIDDEILLSISKRMKLVEQIARIKKEEGINILDEKREEVIYNRIMEEAEKVGLKPENAKKIFERIVEMSRKKQEGNK